VNCWEKDTFFEILDDIILQLRILRAEEHRTSLKLEKLRKHLGAQPLIIILDEIEQIKPSERSTTVYNLDSVSNVGMVCISNSHESLFELKELVRSRLNPYPVSFPAYTARSIMDILTHRASLAL
jgi:Cdc6-like AAA superfamily ATPase